MMPILVCVIQITLISSLAFAASQVCLSRSPRLSAQISWLGIVLSAMVAVATLVDAPRLWAFQESAPSKLDSAPTKLRSAETSMPSPVGSAIDSSVTTPQESFGLTAHRLLQSLTRMRRQFPLAETRMTNGCWLVATAFLLFFLLRFLIASRWLWRLNRSEPVPSDSFLHRELLAMARKSCIDFEVRLCVCDSLASPCVSWISRGTIYVPPDFASWTLAERSAALAHELMHEVRRDPQMRLISEIGLTLVCFHPVMFLLRRQLVFAQELATDQQASQIVPGVAQYRRGLSLLALRMDAACPTPPLVSVSNNEVIRRIQMLNSVKSSLSRWQEVVVVSVVMSMSGIFCAWTVKADDPVRIASRTAEKSSLVPGEQDETKPLFPWDDLGEHDGYLVLRPNLLVGHPRYQEAFHAMLTESTSDPLANYEAFGLSVDNIELLQFPIIQKVTRIPEKDRAKHGGHQFRLSVSCDGLSVKTKQPVQWAGLGETVVDTLPAHQREWIGEQLARSDQKTELRIMSTAAEQRGSQHTDELRSVWSQVSQCAFAYAAAIPDDFELRLDQEVDLVNAKPLLQAVDSAAIGIRLNSAPQNQQIVLAFAPREGQDADHVVSLVKQSHQMLVDLATAALAIKKASDGDSAKSKAERQILDDLGAATIEVVSVDHDREIVVVQVATAVDLTRLMQ